MEEIKVGEYIRTDKGYITQIKDYKYHYTKRRNTGEDENYINLGQNQCDLIESIDYRIPPCYPTDKELELIKKHITKHSSNIIDLIEERRFFRWCKSW